VFSAQLVADIYKKCWQIELFFKWRKQNLKIKTFWGTSRNAVFIQIWVALPGCLSVFADRRHLTDGMYLDV
jgi:IS4 transposase